MPSTATRGQATGSPVTGKGGLNPDQQRALDDLVDGVLRGVPRLALIGYAGTGKTYVTAALIVELRSRGIVPLVTAPTHKASRQIERALRERGADCDVHTVHRALGLRRQRNHETGEEFFASDPGANNLLNPKRDAEKPWERPEGTPDVLIIDEASMLSSDLYSLLPDELDRRPVIFIGDERQLLPVKEEAVSPALAEAQVQARLTDVVRHDGAILTVATATREKITGRARFLPAADGGTEVITYPDHESWAAAAVAAAASEEAQANADLYRICCWRNVTVEAFNGRVHTQRYGPDADPWVAGMACLAHDTIPHPTSEDRGVLMHSSTDFRIAGAREGLMADPAGPEVWRKLGVDPPEPWGCWAIRAVLEGDDDETPIEFYVLDESEERRFKKVQKLIAEKARNEQVKEDRRLLWGGFFRNKDRFGRIQPAAALTIHKSQGSTFENVFLHPEVDRARFRSPDLQNRLAYVGITRAAKTLHVVDDNGWGVF